MYKLSLIDDEHFVLERLKQMIEQLDDKDLILESTFDNGDDAYNHLSVNPPDILITDIHIPFITGIELARMLKKINPLIKIIVITGYEELSYAKEAIDLEVVGFISKPVSFDELSNIINKAKRKIQYEQNVENNIGEFSTFYKENMPILRENYLSNLLDNNFLTDNLAKQFKRLNININYEQLLIAYFDYDHIYDDELKEKFELFLITQLRNYDLSFELFHKDEALIVIFKSNNLIRQESLNDFLNLCILRAKGQLKVEVTIGLSNISSTKHNYRQLYLEAQKAISSRRIFGGLQVYLYSDIKEFKSKSTLLDDLTYKNLTHLVRFEQDVKRIKVALNEIKSYMQMPEHIKLYEFNLSNILNAILKAASDDVDLTKRDVNYNQLYINLHKLKTIDEVFSLFFELALKIQRINLTQIQNKANHNMDLIVNYIENNYSNKDLNLETLAREVCFSISYITTLFKKIRKTTFVKFLTTIRMEKAKELLLNTNTKIIEIATLVGYNDPYYFSHSFKKHYGSSPKEYRNENI